MSEPPAPPDPVTTPPTPTTIDSFVRRAAATSPIPAAPAIATGTVLGGGYELRERLGAGGMATVYRAHDRRLGRDVAVKVPRIEGKDEASRAMLLRMFEREARLTAQLSHPGIVTLHHVGDHDGVPFLVLELLTGETLAARLARRGALPLAEALEVLDGILAALGYAHERGLVHRDLTPRNVFLTADQRVKLLDFGVALDAEASHGTVTRSAGTPGYMPPEHAQGTDPRSDLWAAAVIFVECVGGPRAVPATEARGSPAIPDEVSGPVRAIIARALDRDPARRPTTASDMRAALAPTLQPLRPRRSRTRRRWLLAGAAVLGLALAAVTALLLTRDAPGGPTMPRDGRWRGDPPAGTPWETRLRRLDDRRYAYEQLNVVDGNRITGTLTFERMYDGTPILSGRTAQPACPTCGVGFIEFIVLGETKLYQNRAMHGPSHDNYTVSFPEYQFKWVGPLPAEAASR